MDWFTLWLWIAGQSSGFSRVRPCTKGKRIFTHGWNGSLHASSASKLGQSSRSPQVCHSTFLSQPAQWSLGLKCGIYSHVTLFVRLCPATLNKDPSCGFESPLWLKASCNQLQEVCHVPARFKHPEFALFPPSPSMTDFTLQPHFSKFMLGTLRLLFLASSQQLMWLALILVDLSSSAMRIVRAEKDFGLWQHASVPTNSSLCASGKQWRVAHISALSSADPQQNQICGKSKQTGGEWVELWACFVNCEAILSKCEANRRDTGLRFWEIFMNCVTRKIIYTLNRSLAISRNSKDQWEAETKILMKNINVKEKHSNPLYFIASLPVYLTLVPTAQCSFNSSSKTLVFTIHRDLYKKLHNSSICREPLTLTVGSLYPTERSQYHPYT